MSEETNGGSPAPAIRKFTRKTKKEYVEIDDNGFFVCSVLASAVSEWKTECSNALTFGPDGKPSGVKPNAKDAEIALLGVTLFPAATRLPDSEPAKSPVGYDFVKALPADVVQELSKDARRLNGITLSGDEPKKST